MICFVVEIHVVFPAAESSQAELLYDVILDSMRLHLPS